MPPDRKSAPDSPSTDSLRFDTIEFLARTDDEEAGRKLYERYGPVLHAFLHGRLPAASRDILDTVDIAQEVWAKALEGIDEFDHREAGAFWWYLRRIAQNHLTDIYRRTGRRAPEETLPDASALHPPAAALSPSVEFMASEASQAFDRALGVVPERERNAVLLRLELDQPWEDVARDCGYATPDAARMAVKRALERICQEMSQHAP
jgi:RNA polymerase sigma factor (sigma-70 family)